MLHPPTAGESRRSSHSGLPPDLVLGFMQYTGTLFPFSCSDMKRHLCCWLSAPSSPQLPSPLLSPALQNPKTDLHRLPPLKAGRCPPWSLQQPPRRPRARRHLLLAARLDPSGPRRPPGFRLRRWRQSLLTKTTICSSPTALRRKRVSVQASR